MSINATQGENPTDPVVQIEDYENADSDEIVAVPKALIENMQERIEQLEENNSDQAERIDDLEQETEINGSRLNALSDASIETDGSIDEQSDRIESLDQETDILDNRITAISDGLERLETNDGDEKGGCDGGQTPIHRAEPMTPLERLLDDPQSSGI